MLGFLILIPTYAYALQIAYLLPLLLSRVRSNISKFDIRYFTPLILLLIVLLTQINIFGHIDVATEKGKFLTFVILTPIAYIFANSLTIKDLNVLVFFIVVEAVILIAQSMMGVTTFFTSLEGYETFGDNQGLIYFNRPFGLSNNSSGAAEKFLVGIMMIHFIGEKSKRNLIFLIILIVALALNFGRTAIVSLIFFGMILFMEYLWRLYKSKEKKKKYLLYTYLSFFLLVFIIIFNYREEIVLIDELSRQFTKGHDGIELSGRDEIWRQFISFWEQNPFWGNGSQKYYIDYFGVPAQAHNSFLMILVTHGLLVTLLYILIIIVNINRFNYKYVLTIIVFSMAQYAIFWGISFMDIIFLFFLTNKQVIPLNTIRYNEENSNLLSRC